MYQPLDATVRPARLNKQKSTSLKRVSTAPNAAPVHHQPTPQLNPLQASAKTASPSKKHPPRWEWEWEQTRQVPGEALSQAIAQPAVSGTVQQALSQITQKLKAVKGGWGNLAFSHPQCTQLAIAALLMSLPTGVSVVAFRAIATLPQPRCNQPQQFRADLAELQCLHQAMQSEDQPTLIRSLNQLQNWSSESPVYGLSQRLLEDWSVVALSLAHQEFESGHWDNAARLAVAIPTSLDLGNQAQERLTIWQKIQNQGEKAHDLALEALEKQDWQTARDHAKTLANLGNDYWRKQGIQALPEQIELARQAQQPSAEGKAELSASAQTGLPFEEKRQGQRQRRSQPALPGRSRFTLPLISLKELTVGDPSPNKPEFSATV